MNTELMFSSATDDWATPLDFFQKLDGATVVCLLPARTDTRWWHSYCAKGEIHFVPGRLKFGNAKHSAPFPCAVVVFRPQVANAFKEAA